MKNINVKETVSASKAIKTFGDVMKVADKGDVVRITRYSDSYILIKEDVFDRIEAKELWGINGSAILRAEFGTERIIVELIDPDRSKDGFYYRYDLPSDYVKITAKGKHVHILFIPEDYEANWREGNVAWTGVEAFLSSSAEELKGMFDMDFEQDREGYESILRSRYLIENRQKAEGVIIEADIRFWQ